MLELLEHGNAYSSGGKVMRKRGKRASLASCLSKKRLTVQPFRVKLLLEIFG
jgi:hypothetical protein